MAGLEFDYQGFSEIEPYAIKVYQKHYPKAVNLGDVTKIDGRTLLRIDILTAGFPCQDISIAGKGGGIKASRSGLFFEIIRIAKDCRPRIIFLENVARLISINDGLDFGTVLGELATLGYDAEWNCIPASYVGAPHRRDRIWIIAYPQRKQGNPIRGDSERRRDGVGRHIETAQQKNRQANSDGIDGLRETLANTNRERCEECNPSTIPSETCGQHCQAVNQIGRNWIIESNVGRVAYGIPCRVDRLKGLGNSVVPQVVAFVAETKIIPILNNPRPQGRRKSEDRKNERVNRHRNGLHKERYINDTSRTSGGNFCSSKS